MNRRLIGQSPKGQTPISPAECLIITLSFERQWLLGQLKSSVRNGVGVGGGGGDCGAGLFVGWLLHVPATG